MQNCSDDGTCSTLRYILMWIFEVIIRAWEACVGLPPSMTVEWVANYNGSAEIHVEALYSVAKSGDLRNMK